jgi:hypothetical protein
MKHPNRRKHVRREVNYACWIGAGDPPSLIRGKVRNISEGGAKVVCRTKIEFPETIDLYMTKDGSVGRRCKVVWRSDDAMGLMFVAKGSLEPLDTMIEI